jgi:integrase
MAGKLTAKTAEALTLRGRHTPGRHTDGDGLHLHVRATGEASWVLRYRLHGAQRDMSLGSFPSLSLKAAREAAGAARALVKQGRDPIRERQRQAQDTAAAASRDRTFQAAAEALLEAREAEWRNEKHRWQWRATLTKHAFPSLGALPVSDIDTAAVLRVLRPVWTKTPETASRLRGRIESVMDFAKANGWSAGENPARWKGNLAELLPRPDRLARVQHQPALPWEQVPAFMTALQERRGMAALALRFAILTAARAGEVRGMTWGEVDADTRVWVVPANRMKMRQMHRVPLSDAALAVLADANPGKTRPDMLVFPSAQLDSMLSDMALTMLVRGMSLDGVPEGELPRWRDLAGRAVVPHGFRSSFRDWCGETRPEGREVAERALAHIVRGIEAAYARSDLLEKRRPLMAAWAEWCSRPAITAQVNVAIEPAK